MSNDCLWRLARRANDEKEKTEKEFVMLKMKPSEGEESRMAMDVGGDLFKRARDRSLEYKNKKN